MGILKRKNIHPAAMGSFASYREITANFSTSPLSKISGSSVLKKIKNISPASFLTGNLLYIVLSLPLAIILAVITNKNNLDPAYIVPEYLFYWIVLSLFFIFFTRAKKGFRGASDRFLNLFGKEISKREKSFFLGIFGNDGQLSKSIMVGADRKKRFEHIMIVSPTGGGKTSRYIIPAIINDADYDQTSVFAIDVDAPFLYDKVKNKWLTQGKTVINFDPYSDGGVYFNPLLNSELLPVPDEKLYAISSLIFQSDMADIKSGGDIRAHKYYSKRSTDVFYASLLFIKNRYGINYFNLVTAKNFFEKGSKFIQNEIGNYNGEKSKKIKDMFNNFFELSGFEKARIITDILNALDFLNHENVALHFKTPLKEKSGAPYKKPVERYFFIEDFFKKDILFIAGIPREKMTSGGDRLMSFITGLFISCIYEYRRKNLRTFGNNINNANITDENKLRDIFIYLDEFPSLSLGNFDIDLANLRKTRAGVCLTTQDISFIGSRYGDASLITSNIGIQLVMGSPGYETCEYYSRRSGSKYVRHMERVRKVGGGGWFLNLTGTGTQEIPVASGLFPLISPEEIKQMDKDKVLVYSKFSNPFFLKTIGPVN